jgi:hypothetical protein
LNFGNPRLIRIYGNARPASAIREFLYPPARVATAEKIAAI